MARPTGYICRDFGRPGCESIPDDRYTMNWDDIGEAPIYWCTFCGKQAAALDEVISNAFDNDPGFADRFAAAIAYAETAATEGTDRDGVG